MKRRFLLWSGVGVILCSCIMCSFLPDNTDDAAKMIITESGLLQVLNGAHFQPRQIDDRFSADVFDLYLKRTDQNKKFLLQSDVDELSKMKSQIDDQILSEKLDFFNLSVNLVEKRQKEVESFYKEILSKPFDFSTDEQIETDPEKLKYAADLNALKEEWRKYLKYQCLVRYSESLESQDKLKERKDTVVTVKSETDLEKSAREKVEKTYADFFKRLKQIDRNDRFSIYLNTIANVNDPHTEFFAPKVKDNFDILMSGQLEGIGAQLQERDGFIKVSNIVPGSASWKQGQLKAGDIILKVAQGSEEPVEITDMKLDDAVKLIRGKKGTEVRLTVKKVDGTMTVIPIIRDIVILEETYAKSLIIEENGKKLGYIKLPGFYADFNKPGGRRCATDVKKEIIKLREENVSGIMIDLRNNGGGSLQDVVEMTGFFIEKGPVVQVKVKNSLPEILEDKDPSVLYNGPLVVMVNNISASASEILAAAVQDYGRGVVIGGEQTFGKGTVQRVFNLDDYLHMPNASAMKPFGSVKTTTQKFYRVNGGATQLKGVTPDIRLPDKYEKLFKGEREEDYPMPWDEISPVQVNKVKPEYDLEAIKKKSMSRVSSNEAFGIIKSLSDKYEKQAENTVVSLQLEKYRKEQKKTSGDTDTLDKLEKEGPQLQAVTLKSDIAAFTADSTKNALHQDWLKSVKRDSYIRESVNVLMDMVKR